MVRNQECQNKELSLFCKNLNIINLFLFYKTQIQNRFMFILGKHGRQKCMRNKLYGIRHFIKYIYIYRFISLYSLFYKCIFKHDWDHKDFFLTIKISYLYFKR